MVKRGILIGEPVTYGKVFRRNQAGFLSGMLTPGKRAISVPISPLNAGAGFILPGDRVDVMLQLRVAEDSAQGAGTNRDYSETILEDVRVLAIDQNLNDVPEGSVAQVGGAATLEVTPKEAEMLTVAKVMGTMSLVLRSLTPGDVAQRDKLYTSDLEVSRSISRSSMPDAVQVLAAGRDLEPGTLLRARRRLDRGTAAGRAKRLLRQGPRLSQRSLWRARHRTGGERCAVRRRQHDGPVRAGLPHQGARPRHARD